MGEYKISLTPGYLARHAPGASAQGRSAAFIDVAQDLLLRELHDQGVLDLLVFKGGTAIRKVYAGAAGRFSTDLDFGIRDLDDNADAVRNLLEEACADVELGGVRFAVTEMRGRLHLSYSSDLMAGMGPFSSKLDIGPPPWLEPVKRHWQPLPIHARYGGPLPQLPVVRIEENVAEKMARLNRRTYARDAYDLVWIANQPGLDLDRALVRRLFVLKCWVDLYGLESANCRWTPAYAPAPLDIGRWLRTRGASEFDDEQLGLLTTPPPDLDELGASMARLYTWLSELDYNEIAVTTGGAGARALVLSMVGELPGNRLKGVVW